jgi:isoquinoline 1-oxidoreductase beta subunit
MAPDLGSFSMNRRRFLAAAALAAGTLAIGFRLALKPSAAPGPEGRTINSWVTIAEDETVTIFVSKAEMGQGIHTTMAMLVAEELEVEWESVRVTPAPHLPEYLLGDYPVTSGSRSVLFAFEPLRQAGATAREMLIAAAASRWGIAPESCVASGGHVLRKDGGGKISYGKLAPEAARLVPPPVPPLKAPKDWRLLGKPLRRLDTPAVVTGAARYAIDVSVPGMLVAAVRTSPVFGAELRNLEQLRAGLPAGVRLLPVKNGLAAVSESQWLSQRTLDSLVPDFSEFSPKSMSSEWISASLWRRLESTGIDDQVEHRPAPATMRIGRKISADYEVPFLAHATMEPPVCLAHVEKSRCELWLGTKSVAYTRTAAAQFLDLPHDSVTVNPLPMGGSFGRKGETDFVLQAVSLSQQLGRPVKVVWSREEDIQHDFYRPAAVARMTALLSKKEDRIAFWDATSVVTTRESPGDIGAAHLNSLRITNFTELKYDLPYTRVSSSVLETHVPVGYWRSTSTSHNTFFVESFLDEIAHATGRDPLQLRLSLLGGHPGIREVLEAAARLAGWGRKLPRGQALGLAVQEYRGTNVAVVAEVEAEKASLRVRNLFCAYDCGPVLNPNGAEAQIQGGLLFGLSACLRGLITIKEGRVEQSNFHDYPSLQMHECPGIQLVRVNSGAPVGGIGEVGVALVAPAVANAVFRAGGPRMRRMPFLPPGNPNA